MPPEDLVAAAHGQGVVFDLYEDRDGFSLDVRLVADPVIRKILLDAIQENYDAILEILQHEAAQPTPSHAAAE